MKPLLASILSFLIFIIVNTSVIAYELSGYVGVEGRLFFNDNLFPDQKRDNASFVIQPEYYHEWESGSSFIFVPFARVDSADSERTHFDVRELNYLWLGNNWEIRMGVGKVFWGSTEFLHLVDIINQTDAVEHIDTEDKLGQPMIHLSIPRDWGVVDMLVLPYFRERTFTGRKGRLRSAVLVDTDSTRYESDDEQWHPDFAIRYSHSIGNWDVGIYNFEGTGREPTLLPGVNSSGNAVFIPYYEQINQTGLDLQLVAGEWLWKLEALYRTGQGEDFLSTIGGFEYTFVGIAETGMDLGVISEWAYDDRGDSATTAFENDTVVGLRLAINDAASSELLAGLAQDLDSSSRALSLETSRRFGDNIKVTLDAWILFDQTSNNLYYSLRDDDFIKIELAYYY